MFERRRRAAEAMNFVQSHRHLRSGESIPPLPGLFDQLVACRAELDRASKAVSIDELEVDADWDDADEAADLD